MAGGIHLSEHDIDHAVEEVLPVSDVPIQRHGGGTQFVGEVPHAQGVEATGIGESDG